MVTAVPRSPETTAVIAAIKAANVLCDHSIRPAGGGFVNEDPTQPFTPYCTVYAGIVTYDGPVDDPDADTIAEYQVTSVGVTADQAEKVADKARAALVKKPYLTVAGRNVDWVRPFNTQPVTRDDGVVPPLFFQVDLYQIATSPA